MSESSGSPVHKRGGITRVLGLCVLLLVFGTQIIILEYTSEREDSLRLVRDELKLIRQQVGTYKETATSSPGDPAAITKQLEAMAQEFRNALAKSLATMEQSKLDLETASQKQTIAKLEEAMSELKAKTLTQMEEIASNVDDEIRRYSDQRLAGDRQAAVAAHETAKALLGDGKRDEAKVYLLNAINHNPEDVSLLTAYVEAVLGGDVGYDALNQARSVLQLTIYQVPPQHIPQMLDLIARVEVAQENLAADAAARTPPPPDWAGLFRQLRATDPSIYTDASKLQTQIDELRNIMEAVSEGGTPTDTDLAKQVETELRRWLAIQGAKLQADFVDACLKKLNGQVEIDSNAAASVVQSAENALPQFWALDFESLHPTLVTKIKSYPDLINRRVNQIAEARAAPLLVKIQQCKTKADQIPEKTTIEEYCKAVEMKLVEANREYVKITAPEARKKAEESLQAMSKQLGHMRRSQFSAYQKQALQRCEAALKAYDDTNWNLRKPVPGLDSNEDVAWRICEDHKLFKIDPALVSPEVGRCLNDVLGKLFDKMSAARQVAAAKKINEDKQALEDL